MTFLYHGTSCEGIGFTKCLDCAAQYYGLVKGVPTVLANWVMGLAERGAVDMFLPVSQAVAVGNGLGGGRLPAQVLPNFVFDDAGWPCSRTRLPTDASDSFRRQRPVENY